MSKKVRHIGVYWSQMVNGIEETLYSGLRTERGAKQVVKHRLAQGARIIYVRDESKKKIVRAYHKGQELAPPPILMTLR